MAPDPAPPSVGIFLRDRFTLKRGMSAQFLTAVAEQVSFASSAGIELIAACSDQPFDLSVSCDDPPPPMMHIWRMPEWSSLYGAMVASSELDWYNKLEACIARERQELSVDFRVGRGVDRGAPTQGGIYLFEELRLKSNHVASEFQKKLSWFSRWTYNEHGWEWIWSSSQVTGEPQLLCSLWWAERAESLADALSVARHQPDYNTMMSYVAKLKRRYMYPSAVAAVATVAAAPTP